MRLLDDTKREKIVNIIFYIALTAELLFMVLEKSLGELGFISHVFRLTFLVAAVAVLLMKHDKKEWIIIFATWVFAFICYRISGKNELLRFATFVMAARDIDLRKTMKYVFYFSAVGFAVIALLAILGIHGNMYMTADFGRGSVESRLAMGFGHPNTFSGCLYALLLIWLWVYGQKSNIISYIVLIIGSIGIYMLTGTRTTLAVFAFTVAAAMLVRFVPKLSGGRFIYIATSAITAFCVLFSVLAAIMSYNYWKGCGYTMDYVRAVDRFLNGRIANLYWDNNAHAGAIQSWTLFSTRDSVEYFDMGWVRIFYWYGIIPACLIVALVFLLIYICSKKKDAYTLIIIASLSIYTVIEATFVSRYIGRNMLLPILGVYLGDFIKRRGDKYDS